MSGSHGFIKSLLKERKKGKESKHRNDGKRNNDVKTIADALSMIFSFYMENFN